MQPDPRAIALALALAALLPPFAGCASAQPADELTVYAVAQEGGVRLLWTVPTGGWPARGFRVERLEGARSTVLAGGLTVGSDRHALARLDEEVQAALRDGDAFMALSGDERSLVAQVAALQAFTDYDLALALGLAWVDPEPVTRERRYRVTALDASGAALAAAETPPLAPGRPTPTPAPPDRITAESRSEGVEVRWSPAPSTPDAPPGFLYQIYRRGRGGGSPEVALLDPPRVLAPGATEETTYLDRAAPPGSTLHYSVQAIDAFGRAGARSELVEVFHRDHAALVPPRQVAAEPGPGAVTVTWRLNDSPNTAGYHVERAFGAHGPYERLTGEPVGGASFEDGTGTPGTHYHYAVRSVDAWGEVGAPSPAADATFRRAGELPAPRGLQAKLGVARVLLSWQPAEAREVAGYRVERALAPEGPFVLLTQELLPRPRHEDLLRPGTGGTLHYRITAVGRGEAESAPSEVLAVPLPDVRPPGRPRITGAEAAPGGVVLRWEAGGPGDDLSSWLVLRGTGLDDPGRLRGEPLEPGARAFTDASAAPGERHVYRLVAVDRAGNRSEPSRPVSLRAAEPALPDPPAPEARFASDPHPRVELTFPAPSGAGVRWVVQRQDPEGPWVRIAGPLPADATGATDHRPVRGATARYRLVAVSTAGRPGPVGPPVQVEVP